MRLRYLLILTLLLTSVSYANQQGLNYSGWPNQSLLENWSRNSLPEGVSFYAQDLFRWSEWRYFDPAASGGDPDYGFFSNRLRFGFKIKQKKWASDAALQYVKQFSLPNDAVGVPGGALGLGAVYFGHNRSTSPSSLYVKYLNLSLLDIANSGADLTLGRFAYESGVETLSGIKKIDLLKKIRLEARLFGGFSWSLYQRSFDGFKLAWDHELGHLNIAGFRPTQGGFETNANDHISQINVLASAYTFKPGKLIPDFEIQLFHYYFDDERKVSARADNSGLAIIGGRQDIAINTLGGHVVGFRPIAKGVGDLLVWGAYQTGDWFEQNHSAYGLALEAGFQFTKLPWKPWFRIGTYRGSGDDAPSDNSHGTFYQMLPTVRKYALSTTHNLMNNTDHFVQLLLAPHAKLKLRADVHRVSLTESADLWYGGAGATQASGTLQGFSGRASGGHSNLATSFEFMASYQFTKVLNLTAFYGHVIGDDVVNNNFSDDENLDFFYLDIALDF